MESYINVSSESHFPIQNLPYGVFRHQNGEAHVGVAIGQLILDLTILENEGYFIKILRGDKVFQKGSLNNFMDKGKEIWKGIRQVIQDLLDKNNYLLRDNEALRKKVFYQQDTVEMLMPISIGDYTDFYASKEHATNVDTMFRGKENALMSNWAHLPVGYHGRASSVILSGDNIHRPKGQVKPKDADIPVFTECQELDFELETACFIGPGSKLGDNIPVEQAEEHIFGVALVNDWSARDIQAWEYVPLGPFLAKNFATSISPWIVPMEALEPFRVEGPEQNPNPLPYLQGDKLNSFDIKLEAYLKTEKMDSADRITTTNFSNLYWSMAQQVAHHTITGCNLNPGDMLASGTISGKSKESRGSLMELTWRGADPLLLSS